jgi:signal transduction histidine kinase
VSIFVRDRGAGFDIAAVPQDRRGVAKSIRARIERRGGQVEILSTPGRGTEVRIIMPRTDSGDQDKADEVPVRPSADEVRQPVRNGK